MRFIQRKKFKFSWGVNNKAESFSWIYFKFLKFKRNESVEKVQVCPKNNLPEINNVAAICGYHKFKSLQASNHQNNRNVPLYSSLILATVSDFGYFSSLVRLVNL